MTVEDLNSIKARWAPCVDGTPWWESQRLFNEALRHAPQDIQALIAEVEKFLCHCTRDMPRADDLRTKV